MIHILTSPQKLSGLNRAVVTFMRVSVWFGCCGIHCSIIRDSFELVIVQKIVDLC